MRGFIKKGRYIMKKFNIKVNGKSYEVEVEEVGASSYVSAPVSAPEPVSAKSAAPAAPAPKPSGTPGSASIKAPMPGTINAVKVTAGDTIKKGQVVAVLEAMKMENEIVAPEDATVASVAVTQGQSVNTGDVIVTLN